MDNAARVHFFVQLTIKWRQQNLSISLRLCNIRYQSDVCLGYIRTHERAFTFCPGEKGVCMCVREALLVSSSTVQGTFSQTLFLINFQTPACEMASFSKVSSNLAEFVDYCSCFPILSYFYVFIIFFLC